MRKGGTTTWNGSSLPVFRWKTASTLNVLNTHRHWHPSASGGGVLYDDGVSEVNVINRVVMPRKTSAVGIKAERRWKSA